MGDFKFEGVYFFLLVLLFVFEDCGLLLEFSVDLELVDLVVCLVEDFDGIV